MTLRHRFLPLAALTAGALALTACGADGGTTAGGGTDNGTDNGGTASGAETTLVLGHAGSDTDPRQMASEQFKEIVESESDGRITVEIHGNSTIGTWEQMVEGLQLGSTHVVIESLLSLEAYTDIASIETAPFLYDSPEAFFAVWEGDLGEEIKSSVREASGYEPLGNLYRGPRHLTTKSPVTSIDDLSGMTIRTPSAPTMVQTWQELGARAEAMPWDEVYSALEQGVIDGQENPLDVAVFNSIAEVAPEITLTSHMYANYHFIMWGEYLDGLSEEDQQIIRDAAQQVGEDYTENTAANQQDYTETLQEQGATFHQLEDREVWVERVQPIIDDLPEQVREWASQIQG